LLVCHFILALSQESTCPTTTITFGPPNGMEGSMTAHMGDWVNFGFHYTTDNGASIQWTPSASFIYTCQGSSQSQYYTYSPGQSYTYSLPAGQSNGGNDEHVAWQDNFNSQLPGVCNTETNTNAPIQSTTAGANFSAQVTPSKATCITFQWHYRIPGAKGGTAGNVNLAQWCPANTNNGQYGSTCGASWSATKKYCLCQPVAKDSVTGPTGPVAIAGYTILGLVLIGVLVGFIVCTIRKNSAEQGRHQRSGSYMQDQQQASSTQDVEVGRPAAPSSSAE